MSIANNLNQIRKQLPENVTLVAVSKTKPVSDIMQAYETGQRVFGENKIQEMTEKWEKMPKDIQWHMIGHVQSNKVKYMAPYVALIHGVDSWKLLVEINKQAAKNNRVISCLLQIHIAAEETKFGLNEEELHEIIHHPELEKLTNIRIQGLMGMATFTEEESVLKREFHYLNELFIKYKTIQKSNLDFQTLSMGMSSDYEIAISCGSNMVRIGSSIFGFRN
jgi:pyridoxal phosphate enzyme (YggS family)